MSASGIVAQAAVLLASDVPRAIAYWTEKVGFAVVGTWGEPPSFAILARGPARLMLGGAGPEHAIVPYWKIRPALWNAYFWVDDATTIAAELKERGATIDYDLCIQPYGVLEFGIRDPDDHDIGFGQVIEPATAS